MTTLKVLILFFVWLVANKENLIFAYFPSAPTSAMDMTSKLFGRSHFGRSTCAGQAMISAPSMISGISGQVLFRYSVYVDSVQERVQKNTVGTTRGQLRAATRCACSRRCSRQQRRKPLREVTMNMFGAAETSKFVDASGCLRSSQEGMQLCGPKSCCPGKGRSACAPQSPGRGYFGSILQLGLFRQLFCWCKPGSRKSRLSKNRH